MDLIRQELIGKGMASGKVDQFIIQNQEKLGVDKEIIDLIEANISNSEVLLEEKVEQSKPSQVEVEKEKIVDIESEMKRVKEEISSEEDSASSMTSPESEKEKERVEQKKRGIQHSTGKKIKIDGYSPSPEIAQNSEKIASKGDVNESKTWQAVLIERLEQIWGDIRGLFSTK